MPLASSKYSGSCGGHDFSRRLFDVHHLNSFLKPSTGVISISVFGVYSFWYCSCLSLTWLPLPPKVYLCVYLMAFCLLLLHERHLPFHFQVNIVSCDGKCPSASIYNYNINTYARFCKCCRETGLQRRSVQLYCSSNSTWVSYTIQEPTDCSCQWS